MENDTCLGCGGSLEEGFIADNVSGGATVMQWISGNPVMGRLGTLKGRALRERTVLQAGAFRCMDCGRLEFYARSKTGDS